MNPLPPPPPPAAGPTNLLAILSLPLAVLFSPVGVVLAHVARVELRRTGERGQGLTTAALILGYLISGLWMLFWAMMMLSVAAEEHEWLRLA